MSIKLSGLASGLDTESMVKELVASYNTKKEDYEKEKTKMEWKQEKWKDLNSKIYKFYTGSLSTMKLSSAFNKKKTVASDETKASVLAATNAVTGTQRLIIKKLASSGYLTGAALTGDKSGAKITTATKLTDLGLTAQVTEVEKDEGGQPKTDENGKEITKVVSPGSKISLTTGGKTTEIEVTEGMTVGDLVAKFKDAGVNASFDAENQRFFVNSKESGVEADFTIGGDEDAIRALGLKAGEGGAVKLEGSDAEIELNGATFTSTTNTFSINGLTIEAKELSDYTLDDNNNKVYSAISLSTSMDVDAVYDVIKGFLKEYNALIKELDTVYNADSSRGYDPLTSEEKEAMTDEDVEKWETKIKDSLLRRDGTVSSITTMMKGIMAGSYEINNKKYSLSSFGISTLGYFTSGENEKGVYHIDGDPDDSSTSGNDDKLKSMIAKDPETVTAFFKQLGTDLYNNINKKMQSTTLSSAFTVYNDKQMDDELDDIEEKITKWEDYVAEQEEYWYNKFSQMEKALSELQSSTSAISSLLGTS